MKPLQRLMRLELGTPPRPALGGFVDGLLQTFENCRAGLSDAQAVQGPEAIRDFFVQLYDKEQPRLRATIDLEAHLAPAQRAQLLADTDELVRKVVIPAYARAAAPFTRRERNGFYLFPPGLHGLERLGFAVAGMVVGALVVWAPFIPLWAKEWVLVFGLGGLLLPDLRRVLALRQYQGELNRLVARTDAEIWRLDLAYFTDGQLAGASSGEAEPALPGGAATPVPAKDSAALPERLGSAEAASDQPPSARPRVREGGR